MPQPRLLIDLDLPGSPLDDQSVRCDYLVFAGDGQPPFLVVPIEFKTKWRAKVVQQLQAGADEAKRHAGDMSRLTTQAEAPDGTHWSCRSMARAAGTTHSFVHRVWRSSGLKRGPRDHRPRWPRTAWVRKVVRKSWTVHPGIDVFLRTLRSEPAMLVTWGLFACARDGKTHAPEWPVSPAH